MRKTKALALILFVLAMNAAIAADYILSVPPTGGKEADQAVFAPIAAYLGEATGENISFEAASNWPSYNRNMQAARYDILFDGPHLVGWRMERIEHTPLVRLPGELRYVVVSPRGVSGVDRLDRLEGRTVCSNPAPALDALTLLSQFEGSWNPPVIVPFQGFARIMEGLVSGKCVAAILPQRAYEALAGRLPAPAGILYRSRPVPGNSFSVSPRVPAEIRDAIQTALLSASSEAVLTPLIDYYHVNYPLVEADVDEYRGLSEMLSGFWGF